MGGGYGGARGHQGRDRSPRRWYQGLTADWSDRLVTDQSKHFLAQSRLSVSQHKAQSRPDCVPCGCKTRIKNPGRLQVMVSEIFAMYAQKRSRQPLPAAMKAAYRKYGIAIPEVSPPEISILLPNNQRQHLTLHFPKDVLPYALC